MDAKWYYREILANYGPAAAAAFRSLVGRVGRGYPVSIPDILDKLRLQGFNMRSPNLTGQKRPRDRGSEPGRMLMRSYLPNPGIYRGRIVTGPLHKPGFSKVVKNGHMAEFQYSGEQHMNNCLYVGCSSYEENNLHHSVCISIVRTYYSRFSASRQEFEDVGAKILNIDANSKVYLRCDNPMKATATVENVMDWSGKSLVDAAGELQTNMVQNWLDGYWPVQLYQGYEYLDETSTPKTMIFGMMNLEDLVFSCWSKTYMNVQGTTKADDGSSYTTDITQNPLVGKLFYFKDKVPEVRPDLDYPTADWNQSDDWGVKYLSSHRLASPYITPGQVDAPPITITSADPLGSWKSVPIANNFRNVVREGYVQIDPSNIKRAVIRFKFYGRLIDWMKQYTRFDKESSLGLDDNGNDYSFGTSMLLALEKRVRTGSDVVRVSVHFDTVYGSRVVKLRKRQLVKQTEIGKFAEPEGV